MKYLIIILFLLPNIVLGETIYTDYELYLENTEEYIEESELIKRKEVKFYNTYTEEKEEKYLKISDSTEYQIDYNDFIEIYTNELTYNEYTYDYETLCLNSNYQVDKIRLNNFINNLSISEVKITYDNKPIEYGVGARNASGFDFMLIDNDLEKQAIHLNTNSILSIFFNKKIDLNKLEIKIYTSIKYLNQNTFSLNFNDSIYKVNFSLPFNDNNIITIKFDNSYKAFINNNNFITEDNCISYFKAKTPHYKHTKTNILPLNDYKVLNNTDLFLMDDYKIKYNYYKREKIELNDNIILNENRLKLSDIFISSTITNNDLNIIHNINYEKEGLYKISIYYKDKILTEKEINYYLNETPIKEERKTNFSQSTTKKIKTKEKDKNTKTTTSKMVSKTTQKTTIPIAQTLNQIISTTNNKNNKTLLIIVISIIIIILTIFEIILLYVKYKYF